MALSYRHLPLRIYQIGRKFRDERRPRGGMLRAKEFVMKDMYSFDESKEKALDTYHEISDAYRAILDKLNVPYAVV